MRKMVYAAGTISIVLVLILFVFVFRVQAVIPGVTGTTFNLTAKGGYLSAPDGATIYAWGFAIDGGLMQYPGPTLILQQGATVTVTLRNELPAGAGNVSILFPGHSVTVSGGAAGLLTQEAPPDGTTIVTYTFTAAQPGTYTYYSGTKPGLQVEMGLVGAIIVRPAGFNPSAPRAYSHEDSRYDHEYLFLLTEMDPVIHSACRQIGSSVDTTTFFPVYWFINGRSAPDTMFPAGVPWLPHQPYNCMPRMRPGERLLMRMIGGGRDSHPYHYHGNNALIIARDGRLLQSVAGVGADLAVSNFTIAVAPGETVDAIFEWTGANLGWDIYGHEQDIDNEPLGWSDATAPRGPEDVDHNNDGVFDSVPMEPNEYAPDHGKPFPVTLPGQQEVAFGGQYSGSPFLGILDALPPGEGGLNPTAGYFFMWHSHNEKEMTTNDVFPGGMMTNCIIVPPGTPIP